MNVAAVLLDRLRASGFLIARADDGRIWVKPVSRLSDDDRAAILENRPALLELLDAAPVPVGDALTDAINRTCDLRDDDDKNRAGLIAECLALPLAGQADMLAHFEEQAAIWSRACGLISTAVH